MPAGTPLRVTEELRMRNRCFRATDAEWEKIASYAKSLGTIDKVSVGRAIVYAVNQQTKKTK